MQPDPAALLPPGVRRHPVEPRGEQGEAALAGHKGEIGDAHDRILQIAGHDLQILKIERNQAQDLPARHDLAAVTLIFHCTSLLRHSVTGS